jgi:N-acetyl-anhydromuramyl-L-alanine amidase AmpD
MARSRARGVLPERAPAISRGAKVLLDLLARYGYEVTDNMTNSSRSA